MRLFRLLQKKRQHPSYEAADLTFKYGTHLPVLQTLLEVFEPHGILELGVGKVSTPLFYQYGKKLISVETNREWFEEIAGAFPERPGFTLVHHALKNVSERSKIGDISQQIKNECVSYYRSLIAAHPDLDLLFIDHVSGVRAFTLVSLYAQFDFVVYHDADDHGYGYDLFKQHDGGSHFHYVLRSLVPYTGLLIRKTFAGKLAYFTRALDRHTKDYFFRQYHFDLKQLARAG